MGYSAAACESGMDHYHEQIINLERVSKSMLPLTYIGAYNDFDAYIKLICITLKTEITSLPAFKGIYIYDCRKYLKDNSIAWDADLEDIYKRLLGFNEYRNVIAHNDYFTHDRDRKKLLKRIGVNVIRGAVDPLKKIEILEAAVVDFNHFSRILIEKIATIL